MVAVFYAEASLDWTLGTIVSGVMSNSTTGANTTFVKGFVDSLGRRDDIGEV